MVTGQTNVAKVMKLIATCWPGIDALVEPKYQVVMPIWHRFPAILVVSDQGAEAGVDKSTVSSQHSDHYRRDSSVATFEL